MKDFRFSEEQWLEVAREFPSDCNVAGARWEIEFLCDRFIRRRLDFGKGLPTPDAARQVWLDIETAAHKLDLAIAKLAGAGAADMKFIDCQELAAALPSLRRRALWAADMESTRRGKPANNADPDRDWFVETLVGIWKQHTKLEAVSDDGPMMRYLLAVTESAYEAANEKKLPTVDMLRGVRRKMVSSAQN